MDSGKLVASTARQPLGGFFGGYKFTSRKKSSIGKKEAPLPVHFGSGLPTSEPADAVIHLIREGPRLPKELQFTCAPHEVMCEPGISLGCREKLDVLLMGAAMAAISATQKQRQPGGA